MTSKFVNGLVGLVILPNLLLTFTCLAIVLSLSLNWDELGLKQLNHYFNNLSDESI